MDRIYKTIGVILLIILSGYLVWRFSFLFVYLVIAALVSFIGHPIVRFLDKIRIGKVHIPHGLSAFISLFLLLGCFFSLIAIFVPLIFQEALTISRIDIKQVSIEFQGPLSTLQYEMNRFGLIPAGQTLQDMIAENAKSFVSITSVTNFLNGLLGFAGSFFIDLFSIIFIAFFFLKDDHLFENIVLIVLPEKYSQSMHKVFMNSIKLLRRYFIGVIIEIIGGMTLITIGFLILGVDNALLLGFLGGLINIIPYLGPIFGTVMGLTLGFSSALAAGEYSILTSLAIKIAVVVFGVHLTDTMLYQPIVYSKSVKAHPLEIFIVILIGGSLGGIVGMLIAVPSYTLLRVIAREFFNKFRVVEELTRNI
jgi:predicted PurR-regulated permease PerM